MHILKLLSLLECIMLLIKASPSIILCAFEWCTFLMHTFQICILFADTFAAIHQRQYFTVQMVAPHSGSPTHQSEIRFVLHFYC